VFVPREVGVKATRSSSSPDVPVTLNDPVVLRISFPSGANPMTSIFSLLADKPTSEPSKYHSKEPVVFVPNDVGMKRTISESSTLPRIGSVVGLRKLNNMLPSVINRKASRLPVARPTSEPSK